MPWLTSFIHSIKTLKSRLAPAHRWVYTSDETERTCTICQREEYSWDDPIAGYQWGEKQAGRAHAHDPRPQLLGRR